MSRCAALLPSAACFNLALCCLTLTRSTQEIAPRILI